MDVPEHLWRYPAQTAIESLASRFGFVLHPRMQDPEVAWADAERIDEFLAAYESDELNEDECFTLMAITLNSFEFADRPLALLPQWPRTLALLERDIATHIHSVLYFANPRSTEEDWVIGRDLWRIAARHADAFGYVMSSGDESPDRS